MARALVNVPKTARRGEVIEVKVLLAHPMETGFRPGPDGAVAPAPSPSSARPSGVSRDAPAERAHGR